MRYFRIESIPDRGILDFVGETTMAKVDEREDQL